MKRLFLFTLALALWSGLALGQVVSKSQVTTDANVLAGEAWVVTDPNASQTVAVIWLATRNRSNPVNFNNPGYCGVAVSTDGGQTWTRNQLPFKEVTGPQSVSGVGHAPICGDPVAGVGPNGDLYAAAANVGSPHWTQSVTSTDGGKTWSEPAEVFGVSQQVASAMANMAVTDIGMGRAYMAVDPNTGEISVHSQVDAPTTGRMITFSTDRGATWSTPRPVGSTGAGPHASAHGKVGVAYVSDGNVVFQTTTDQGQHWDPKNVTSSDAAVGLFGGPAVAADPSQAGRFAVLLSRGDSREVWVTTDSGDSWASTVVAQGPFTMSGIAYSPSGALGVVWRTSRTNGAVRARVSPDGGTTFGDVVELATGVTAGPTPGDDCACNLHLDATYLSATWSDDVDGASQIFYGRFDYTTGQD